MLFREAQGVFQRRCGRASAALGLSLARLGAMYRDMGGRGHQAETTLVEAKEILEPYRSRHPLAYAMCLVDLAGVYCSSRKYDIAESLLDEAEALFRRVHGPGHYEYGAYLSSRAALYASARRVDDAEALYLQARDVIRATRGPDHPDYARALNNLVRLYVGIGRMDSVASLVREASDILERDLERTGAQMNESQQEQYLEMVRSEFELYQSCFLAMAHRDPAVLGEMFDHRLALKGRLFVSARALRRRIEMSGSALEGRFEEWLREQEKQNAARGMTAEQRDSAGYDLERIAARSGELERDLRRRSEVFARAVRRAAVTWRDVRDSLRPGEAAVEIVRFRIFDGVWTDSVCYAALIVDRNTDDHPRMVLLPGGNALEQRGWILYREGIRQWIQGSDQLADAYALFWKDIDEALGRDTIVFFSPDGVFNQINVETLVAGDGRYVGERRRIRLLSSTRVLATRMETPAPRAVSTAYLAALPDYWMSADDRRLQSRGKLSLHARAGESGAAADGPLAQAGDDAARAMNCQPLIHSGREVRAIDSILLARGWETTVDTTIDALEENVKAVQQPRVLHLSTHGFFLEDADGQGAGRPSPAADAWELQRRAGDPLMRSGLLFAGACESIRQGRRMPGVDDGILYADEAQALNLEGTQLVVLSACETGLGVVKAGEGVYGLQRSLQLAGARAVLMSLWSVNDAATSLLMRKFYGYWLAGAAMPDALRKARDDVRRTGTGDFASPYYWGAFVLMEG
jgi:CHAT domain-containing protein